MRRNRPYIWCIRLLIPGLLTLVAAGCGLPQYVAMEKPTPMLGLDSDLYTDTSTVLGFITPAIDTNITGYVLYYKVYTASRYDEENSDDKAEFNEELTYIANDMDMPTGQTIPNQQGFFKAGTLGKGSISNFVMIAHPGPGVPVYLDFDSGETGGFSDSSTNPIVGVSNPVQSGAILVTLARGFIDPTTSDTTFRSFVADWNYDDGDGDDFFDGDLRKGVNKITNQPGTTIEDIENVGDPLDVDDTDTLRIAFAVNSYGWNSSSSSGGVLESKPVYIGNVTYGPPVNDTAGR